VRDVIRAIRMLVEAAVLIALFSFVIIAVLRVAG
jgi:hypothetical protein